MSMTAVAVRRPHWSESLAHPLRSFHTIRHLKAGQVVNRASRLLQRLSALPSADGHLVLRRRGGVRPAVAASGAFDGRSFCFLNRRFAWEGSDRWHPSGADDLWVYNLHYFRYLWEVPDHTAHALIADWIATHTSPRTFAWHPYPISLRVREWIEWLLVHDDVDQAFHDTMVDSIGQQVEALRHQLEFHLLGNHLLENAITLCWAGLSFDGPAAVEWLSQGVVLLRTELGRQVLADGSHDERSPMYQALLAEAVLRLNEVAAQSDSVHAGSVFELTQHAGANLLRALGRLAHPDGGYALLNDAALGIAPSLGSLTHRFGAAMASAPAGRTWSLPSAGYLGYHDAQGGYLVFDAGAIGPDHQPGHGHADTLSFELSHRGRRIVTDTGVFTYASGEQRRYDRSTAAHNTVEIDGRDQSELWGAFRCARRPSVHIATIEDGRSGSTLTGGYRGPGLRGGVAHTRQIFVSGQVLAFTDSLIASGDRTATLRLHLAPGLRVRQSGDAWIVEDHALRQQVAAVVGSGIDWTEVQTPYHPEFGQEQIRPCLTATASFRDRATMKWWLLLN
jgi:uncharacterized heparinase superfamily protein